MPAGVFIAFEGIEGSGKSTQVGRLASSLEAAGREVVSVREPGGTTLGDRVRAILLDKDQVGMSPVAEMLLFAASRAQIIHEVIRPALARGAVVICDRFLHSSLAYQGHARALGRDRVLAANQHATEGLLPDRVLLLAVPPEHSLQRALARSAADRFEQEGMRFHRAVADGFMAEASADPDRFVVIDGAASIDAVAAAVHSAVLPLVPELA
jgi:dTMP kinase